MEDRDLPRELVFEFDCCSYKSRYYKGTFYISHWRTNQLDGQDRIPDIHNNELCIELVPDHWNDKTYLFTFTIKETDVELKCEAYKNDGAWFEYQEIPHGKRKITKLLNWLRKESSKWKKTF